MFLAHLLQARQVGFINELGWRTHGHGAGVDGLPRLVALGLDPIRCGLEHGGWFKHHAEVRASRLRWECNVQVRAINRALHGEQAWPHAVVRPTNVPKIGLAFQNALHVRWIFVLDAGVGRLKLLGDHWLLDAQTHQGVADGGAALKRGGRAQCLGVGDVKVRREQRVALLVDGLTQTLIDDLDLLRVNQVGLVGRLYVLERVHDHNGVGLVLFR